MSLTKLLILSCLLVSLLSCRYGFVPEGNTAGRNIVLEPSTNGTHLLEAGMVLDTQLERAFSDLGLLAIKEPQQRLSCTIVSARRERTTAGSITSLDRYRLTISVHVRLSDTSGRVAWQRTFSDQGAFSEGSQDEDALEEACRKVSLQIARAVAALSL